MKKYLLICLTLPILLISACSDNSLDAGDTEATETGENFVFLKSEEMAKQTEQNRSNDISDPFEINNVRIEDKNGKKLMHIDVTQTQGCEETYTEKFEVIWDGIMLMIYPPQIGFYLKFNADGCQELVENIDETITLDLYEIFGNGDKEFVDAAVFTVINASRSSTENDHEVER